jgi:2-keto-4-pentenoate hydratase/2-oxohepta-3-ene-1,7-dioic acid hydratase in catechol pathway
MKIVRLRDNGKETFGFIKDDKIATKEEITYQTGIPLPLNIKEFLFDGWYEEVMKKQSEISYNHNISNYEILAPIPNPSKIICLAFNYKDHAKEQDLTTPEDPAIVIKPRTTLCGTESDIICPDFVTELDYEIELAFIIGKTSKNITEEDAMKSVFGYMIFNDVTARDIQMKDKQFTRGKSFDTFAPCGPWITTAEEIENPHDLKLVTKVNGETRQDASTSYMSIKIPTIISKLSKVMTLEKGDIISTGTPSGVILKNPNLEYLKNGDVIEMEIDGLGKLKNTIQIVST